MGLVGLKRLIHHKLDDFIDEIIELCRAEFSSHHKGIQWERDFLRLAKQHNLSAEKDSKCGRGDVKVENRRVQCKHLDAHNNGLVSIDNMRPVKANENNRGYMVGEYDVFALKHNDSVYLISATELVDNTRPGWLKNRIRICDYRHCVDNWTIFSGGEGNQPLDMLFT